MFLQQTLIFSLMVGRDEEVGGGGEKWQRIRSKFLRKRSQD